jgi:hypothetical protein
MSNRLIFVFADVTFVGVNRKERRLSQFARWRNDAGVTYLRSDLDYNVPDVLFTCFRGVLRGMRKSLALDQGGCVLIAMK